MNEDDVMDQLLKKAMAADAPELSPGFDDRVLEQLRPRRLTGAGRAVIAIYIVVATGTTAWLMRDLSAAAIASGLALSAALAAATSVYGRVLARN
jgi:hypothetical protein